MKVPKKNVDPNITDVVAPGGRWPRKEPTAKMKPALAARFAAVNDEEQAAPSVGATPFRMPVGRLVAAFVSVVALVLGTSFVYAYRANRFTIASLSRNLADFYSFFGREEYIEPASAAPREELAPDFGGFWDVVLAVKGIGKHYDQFQSLSGNAVGLLAEMRALESEWLPAALSGDGSDIIARLERIRTLVGAIQSDTARLAEDSALASRILPVNQETYFETKMDLDQSAAFLDRLIAWLKEDRPHRIAIFLENPSEPRPGGGFIGSYADVTIVRAAITDIHVYDVNDADRLFERTIVPPSPLQLIVRRWRAADSNWFFDFGESASTTLGFLESSGLYGPARVRFEAAIGLSARAVEDMLEATGPITLADGTKLERETFLRTLQKSVQDAQAGGAAAPKSILQEFAPLLIARLASLAPEGRAALEASARRWFSTREVRLFARDETFEGFFRRYGFAGDAFVIPERFQGDYFALVDAAIGGGKSDFLIKRKVTLEVQIFEEGVVEHRATVARTHTAGASDPSWYRETNQVFTRVLALPSAVLTYAQGGSSKTITPRVDYAGYETDPRVVRVEKSVTEQPEYPSVQIFSERGKTAFGTWMKTNRGETSEFALSYRTKLAAPVASGGAYQFVFERQSGVEGDYHFEIHAPVGYVFKENNLPTYEYLSSDPPGRLTIDLTFEKITDQP